MSDLLEIAKAVVKLVRGLELDEAVRRVAEARQQASSRSHCERAREVSQVNKVLHAIKTQRQALREAVTSLPEHQQLQARIHVELMLESLFEEEELELRSSKRRISRPR